MKAVKYTSYGSPEVLQLVECEKPVPTDNEILIRIHATTVTATETTFRKGEPYFSRLFTGLTKPRLTTLGEELSGVVEAIGRDVTRFKVGDEIFGTAGPKFGANAEYLTSPEDGVLAIKPSNLDHEEAAASVDGFLTALPFLRDTGNIQKGLKVLIYGASGSIGATAVQVANYYGTEVTAVCSSANVEWVKALGAKHVIDYTKQDFNKTGETYDIVFDAVGKISFSQSKKSLTPKGIFLEAGFSMGFLIQALLTSMGSGKKARTAATGLRKPKERTKDLELLKELLESGQIKPVVDRTYPLDQIADAHRYVELGHKKGNVAIAILGKA
ncbi:MAG: NAD(P)-dependent alcohol dehydrogenase [FCB group bacterium]|nr:NAD(P)-dependent alcohol dehydrogenase [FCB group bacterium]MBL7123250.1 NAD(P)-dependent alcohol dehydrogenase [Candidatus Neomarinimicrobiota bacterium]